MADDSPITREEMIEMFGDYMPMEAVNLVFNAPPTKTIGELRVELRKMALERRATQTEVAVSR